MIKKMMTLLILVLTITAAQAEPTQPLDSIVAVVNSHVITASQLTEQTDFIKDSMPMNQALPPASVLQHQVLNQLIVKSLQLQLAKLNGIAVSPQEVNKAIQRIADKNNQSVAMVFASVAKDGLNKGQFKQEIRDELIIHKVQAQNVASRIIVTPQEVKNYLSSSAGQSLNPKEYHLEDILIALPSTPSPAQVNKAKLTANNLIKKLRKGADFKKSAMALSTGANALKGGDLGWKRLIQLPDVFASRVPNMKVGDIAGPIRTSNGFHVIKLLETKAANSNHLTPAQLKEQVQNLIFQRKFNENLATWLSELRASAYIKTFKPNS
jgi:peptidyl-prolyl cis-trans isomerase SurA